MPNSRSEMGLIAIGVLALSLASCGGGAAGPTTTSLPPDASTTTTTGMPANSPIPVVVDTDGAIDDLVALTFLLSSDDIDVRAIAVSGTGEVRCPAGVGVVRALLARTGDEDVPVACGRSAPLTGSQEFPAEWRDAADSGWGVLLPSSSQEPDYPSAVELLGATLVEGVRVLTLGPLTNIAEAMRADDDLADRIASIVVMGGAVDVVGNVVDPTLDAAHSEWNVFVDPTAASEVLTSGAPVLLVGLDATNHVPVTPLFLERLALNSHTAAAELVAELYGANPLIATGGAYFWDPLAAAALLEPGLLDTERVDIAVVTEAGAERGRTVRSDSGSPVEVATDADAAGFEELLLRTLDAVSLDEVLIEPPPPVGEAVVRYGDSACTFDGPTTVAAGRMSFVFETDDPTWVAAIAHLTGELTIEEIVAWVVANPNVQGPVPGVDEVTVVPPGAVTYVTVRAPGAGVVCSRFEPGDILIAESLVVE